MKNKYEAKGFLKAENLLSDACPIHHTKLNQYAAAKKS